VFEFDDIGEVLLYYCIVIIIIVIMRCIRTVPPEINGSRSVEESSVVIGDSAELHCYASGVPQPTGGRINAFLKPYVVFWGAFRSGTVKG